MACCAERCSSVQFSSAAVHGCMYSTRVCTVQQWGLSHYAHNVRIDGTVALYARPLCTLLLLLLLLHSHTFSHSHSLSLFSTVTLAASHSHTHSPREFSRARQLRSLLNAFQRSSTCSRALSCRLQRSRGIGLATPGCCTHSITAARHERDMREVYGPNAYRLKLRRWLWCFAPPSLPPPPCCSCCARG